jgi:hypothetical protein
MCNKLFENVKKNKDILEPELQTEMRFLLKLGEE